MRRAILIFSITWLTAFVLIITLGDFNTYIVAPKGYRTIKDRGTPTQRVIESTVLSGLYSLLNTACLLWLFKLQKIDE